MQYELYFVPLNLKFENQNIILIIKEMKKYFYLLMACCLPAITLVSCGDDDDEPTSLYVRGIYNVGEQSAAELGKDNFFCTWLKNRVDELNKTYADNRSVAFANDEAALAQFDDADQALKDLKVEFSEKMEKCDFGQYPFSLQYQYRVSKAASPVAIMVKETGIYDFTYKYEGKARVYVEEPVAINATEGFKYTQTISSYFDVSMEKMNFVDGDNVAFEVVDGMFKVVNNNTYEYYSGKEFLGNPIIEEVNDEGNVYHKLTVQYELNKDMAASILGDWYILARIKAIQGDESMSFDVQIPVSIQ